jgi:large subunit ribosomal protein L22
MKTALADAENNFELEIDRLVVKEATVGEGPTFKRFKPRARGSASAILKRTAHIRVVLTDDDIDAKKEKKFDVSPEKRKGAPKGSKKKEQSTKSEAKSSKVDGDKGKVYSKRPDDADDLTELEGVGPKLAEKLNSEGIYCFQQIADWTDENIAVFEDLLSIEGRVEKNDWVKAAKKLAKG